MTLPTSTAAVIYLRCQTCGKRFAAYSPTARHCSTACRELMYLKRLQDSETHLQRKVLELAAALGWRSYHTNNSQHSAAGFPDLILCRPPRLVVAELKSTTGVVTAAQRDWLADMGACPGLEVYTWRPADLPTATEVLR